MKKSRNVSVVLGKNFHAFSPSSRRAQLRRALGLPPPRPLRLAAYLALTLAGWVGFLAMLVRGC